MRFFKTDEGEYGYGDEFLGVRVPQVRSVVRRHWECCDSAVVRELISSRYHEVRLSALLILVRRYRWAEKHDLELADAVVDFYLRHTCWINSWDLVDLSCYEVLGRWVQADLSRSVVLYELAHSKNMWEQRIAIVSTLQLIRHGEFDCACEIADILLMNEHDLVRKAVGWMLREVGKRDRRLLEAYLKPRYGQMPRTMLRYAIERFPKSRRMRYLSGGIR